MRLGLYIIASIILMTIVGVFVYTMNPGYYSYDEFGFPINLPVAVWMVLPMLLLLIASVVHMMFYGTKNFFKFKKWEKDIVTLDDALYWSLLNEPKAHKFNLKPFKKTASLLSVSDLKVRGEVSSDVSERLSEALTFISEIEDGHYVDLKAKKLDRILSKDNKIVQKNLSNRIEEDESFAEEVIVSHNLYSEKVFNEALEKFASTTNFLKARKHINKFNKESFFTLLNRVVKDEELECDKVILDEFIVALEPQFECVDYLQTAISTMQELSPDDNLAMWKGYQNRYSKAEIAYLYLLFDYEMIDEAGNYLEEHDESEFKRFRALYDLKKEHKKYKITDLMNVRHICDA